MRRFGMLLILVLIFIAGYWGYEYMYPVTTERTTTVSRVPLVGENSLSASGTIVSGYSIVELVTGLEVPRAVVQTSPQRILVTERPGRVRQIVDGVLWKEPLLTIPEISNKDEEGLMSIVLDPAYGENNYVYLCYVYVSNGGMVVKVVRYTDARSTLEEPFVVLDMLPASQRHAGSALAFGPDGYLYITVGDAVKKDRAQDLDTYNGKILRISSEGKIPEDNPFSGSAIRSYGHRNSQGIAWTDQGVMYASEHGPSTFDGPPGGDELNHIVAGGNYGWPLVSHEEITSGTISPLAIYTPAIAPASLLLYSGDMFPEWKGKLFMGMLKGEGIVQLTLDPSNPDKIISTQKIADTTYGRIRFVGQGADGSIYFTTSNEDGRGKKRPQADGVYQIRR